MLPPTQISAGVSVAHDAVGKFLQISFDSSLGSLAAGGNFEVEFGFHEPNYVQDFDQSNDYSYVPTATGTHAEWDLCPGAGCPSKFKTCKITAFVGGNLAWGTPP